MIHALVLGRKRKGRKIGEAVRETHRLLDAAGWRVESALVKRKRELRSAARQGLKDKVEVVVVVGGDGAVMQVVGVLAETQVALGIVPKGTGNLLAGNIGVPHKLDKAVETLLTGNRRRIDVGRLTIDGKELDFAVACGIGFDARVMDATATTEKSRWGKLAYVANAIGEARHLKNVKHEITIDGERLTTMAAQVFVANLGRVGGPMQPRLKVRGDDGLLDVIVVRASGPLPGLLAGWEALRQRDLGESGPGHVLRAQAREVRVETSTPRLVEIDGSVVGKTPITVTIRPAALTVIEPAT
jgi:YegS/Rv2252/BmrU family lipid kinase